MQYKIEASNIHNILFDLKICLNSDKFDGVNKGAHLFHNAVCEADKIIDSYGYDVRTAKKINRLMVRKLSGKRSILSIDRKEIFCEFYNSQLSKCRKLERYGDSMPDPEAYKIVTDLRVSMSYVRYYLQTHLPGLYSKHSA